MKKRMTILLDEDLEKEFRDMVGKIYGFHKGAFTRAIEDALKLWIKIKKEDTKNDGA